MSVRSEEGESMDVKVDTLVDMITKSRPDFEASSSLKPKEQLSLEPYFPDEALLLMRFKTKSREEEGRKEGRKEGRYVILPGTFLMSALEVKCIVIVDTNELRKFW